LAAKNKIVVCPGDEGLDMRERFSIWRAILVGSILCCVIPVMEHVSLDIVHASTMAIDFMPVAAIFLFFVLVLLCNTLVRALNRRWALTRPELLVVYTMLIVCCSITSMGLGAQILPIMSAPFQFATAENRWAETILPHVPRWLTPDPEAASGFFVGLDKGGCILLRIPWGAWIRPLAGWLAFIIPAYFVMIAVMVILRKQWVEREHLIFPLTVLPAAMSESPEGKRLIGPFFRNPVMWIGFGLVFLVTSTNALHSYWDFFPTVNLVQNLKILRNTTTMQFRLSFPVLGFAFLINTDLAFSLWFFNLVFQYVGGMFKMIGLRLDENLGGYGSSSTPIFAYLGMGSMAAFVLGGLYNSREHLKGVLARALGRETGTDDSDEILSYRTAVWGIVVSVAIMWAWLSLVGLNPFIVPLYLFLAYILFLGLTRVVSEGGLPTIVAAMIAPTVVMSMLGVKAIGAAGLMALSLMYVWSADIRIFPMAECAQGLKLVEQCPNRRRRGIFWAMVVALVISFVVSIFVSLALAYKYGGITLRQWFFVHGPKVPFRMMAEKLQSPSPLSIPGYLLMGLGALVTVALAVLRASFSWFGLHPIGFAVGSVWLMNRLWFSVFLAWLIKALVLRYGGPLVYKKVVPFFLGLVLGQYTAAAFWFVVDLCTGKTGNVVFWI